MHLLDVEDRVLVHVVQRLDLDLALDPPALVTSQSQSHFGHHVRVIKFYQNFVALGS